MNRIQMQKTFLFIFAKTQLLTLLILTLPSAVLTQFVDLNFDPAPGGRASSGSIASQEPRVTIQPDGKILLFGIYELNNVSGRSRNLLSRLKADGTFDDSFNYENPPFELIGKPFIQSDGKMVFGGFDGFGADAKLVRLNADGSPDPTFTTTLHISFAIVSSVMGIQPDGKILAYYGGSNGDQWLNRFNIDGSVDATFQQVYFNAAQFGDALFNLKILKDGKIMVAGSHRDYGKLFVLNSNGTIDNSFTSPTLTFQSGNTPKIYDFDFQSNGKIVIFGDFISVNGVARSRNARLNSVGSLDNSFANTSLNSSYYGIKVLSDDTILVSPQIKLTAVGAMNNKFQGIPGATYFTVDNADNVIVSQNDQTAPRVQRIAKFDVNGVEDNSFTESLVGRRAFISVVTAQPDGKILVFAWFMGHINGVRSDRLFRLNNDGTIDTTFNHSLIDQDTLIRKIILQNDGKILLGGDINTNSGLINGIVRLNSDGSTDTSFLSPSANSYIIDFELQTDGKIIIGGAFNAIAGQPCQRVARLNSDGSLDSSFQCPTFTGNNSVIVSGVESLPNGQVLVAGKFTQGINGVDRDHLALLNSNGTLDESFNANLSEFFDVKNIFSEGNGKFLHIINTCLRRINANGSPDNTFIAFCAPELKALHVQPDGTFLIGGNKVLVRLKNNGTVEPTFSSGLIDRGVEVIARQANGQIIVAGDFTNIKNVARSALARINPPAIDNSRIKYDFDGDGKADVAVYRPSESKWYVLRSSDFGVTQQVWGISGDSPTPADHDGDGKSDYSVYRNSNGYFWNLGSTAGVQVQPLGQNGDIPRPSDFDGDGRADYIVYRPSNFTWYRTSRSNGSTSNTQFGAAGDKPIVGDFNGDGRSDVAIYRPSTGEWWWQSSVDNIQRATRWGISSDIPSPGDYDGDGKTDFAVYRPSDGLWYVLNSSNQQATIIRFGIAEDKPVPADYDGDGKTDIAVYRPSTGVWYLLRSTEGFTAYQFGISTDIPIPYALIP